MTMTVDDYVNQFHTLLPQGPLWDSLRRPNSQFNQLLRGIAEEFVRLENRTKQLTNEVHPLTTAELLEEWENMAGLPNSCVDASTQTLTQRRNALLTKLTLIGDNRIQYLIDVATQLGYTITITEQPPYAWQVNAPATTIVESTCESRCTDPLRVWGDQELECALDKINPAHLQLNYSYGA